jgi:hypothetical protein
MNTRFSRKSSALAAFALIQVMASLVNAADFFWDGTTGNWNDSINWQTDVLPGASDAGRINNGGTALIDDSGGAVFTGFVILADSAGTSGNLRMTGASLTTGFDIRIGGNSFTSGGVGVFEQTSGSIIMNGGNVNVGFGTNADTTRGTGTYTMSGGSLQLSGSNIFAVGNRGVGTVSQSGGTIYVRGGGTTGPAGAILQLGRNTATVGASGTFTLSGGATASTRVLFGQAVQTSGVASVNTFNLEGTGTLLTNEITVNNTAATNTFNFTGGTLTARAINIPLTNNGGALAPAGFDLTLGASDFASIPIDPIGTTTFSGANGYTQSATGNLAIDIAALGTNDFVDIGAGGIGAASLAGRITVNMLNNFNPPAGSFFDILAADTILNSAVVIGGTPGGGVFAPSTVIGGDGREVLRLTVVPEPATAALLAGAFLALSSLRRRRTIGSRRAPGSMAPGVEFFRRHDSR